MNNINIGLIIDRSGSVENEKLTLENSIKLLIESFKRKYKESNRFKITINNLGKWRSFNSREWFWKNKFGKD